MTSEGLITYSCYIDATDVNLHRVTFALLQVLWYAQEVYEHFGYHGSVFVRFGLEDVSNKPLTGGLGRPVGGEAGDVARTDTFESPLVMPYPPTVRRAQAQFIYVKRTLAWGELQRVVESMIDELLRAFGHSEMEVEIQMFVSEAVSTLGRSLGRV